MPINVEPLLTSGMHEVTGAVVGTPILSAGDPLVILDSAGDVSQTAELVEDAAVGDTQLWVDLDDNMEIAGDPYDVRIHYWGAKSGGTPPGTATIPLPAPGDEDADPVRAASRMVRATGEAVYGFVSVEFVGPVYKHDGVGPSPSGGNEPRYHVDAVGLTFTAAGRSIGTLRFLSGNDVRPSARVLETTPVVIGDGPGLDSDTRLAVTPDGGSTWLATQRGADTGWKVGAYADAEASTGRRLSAVQAREGLRQVVEPARRVQAAFRLTGQEEYSLDRAVLVRDRTRLAQYAATGETEVLVDGPVRVGSRVRIALADGTVHETTCSVAGGAGPYAVTLADAMPSAAYRTARVWHDFAALWDYVRFEPRTGGGGAVCYVEATELHFAPDALLTIESITAE